jgi:hypothetical protein
MPDAPSHYKPRQLEFMAAWFPGDPNHEPGRQLCPCGAELAVVKDPKGVEWYACSTEAEAIAAGTLA